MSFLPGPLAGPFLLTRSVMKQKEESKRYPMPGRTFEKHNGEKIKIIEIAKHSETLEELVIYRPYLGGPVVAQPLYGWFDTIEVNGKMVKKFHEF